MLMTLSRPLLWQSGVVGLASLLGAMFGGVSVMFAILYGGGVSIVNLALLIWRWHAGSKDYHCDARKHLMGFYRSSLERFFVVGILLALWFVLVKSGSLAVLTGFLIGLVAGMTATVAQRERT
jgi:hypothetical protein